MAYIGRNLEQFSSVEKLDNITFTNSAGPYNLTKSSIAFVPASTSALLIEVDGVIQASDSYSINGSTITFGQSMPSSLTMNNMIHFGIGFISTPDDNTVTTNKLVDNSVTTNKLVDNSVTTAKLLDSNVTNAKLAGSIANSKLDSIANSTLTNSSITINGSAVSLGGSVTIGETKPTIANVSQTIAPATATSINITGTNFSGIPTVQFIKSDTGAITSSNTVSLTSSTTIAVNCTIATGTYYVRVELDDGNAARSTNAIITASTAPVFNTGSGSLGVFAGNFSGTLFTISASSDSAITFAETTSVLSTAGVTLNTSTGALATTDFGGASTTPTTYTFTLRITDQEAQTTTREFSMTSSFGATGGGQFN